MNFRQIIYIIVIIAIIFITSKGRTYAASPTGTASPSATTIIDKLKQIEALKEKIATKVAQLREQEKGGANGIIKSIGNNTITLTTASGEQTISYSEDTIFFKLTDGVKSDPIDWKQSKKLKSGDQIAVLGYFDSTHSTLSAKYIYLYNTASLHLIGKIADIDKSNYTITVKEPKGNTLVDIETYTKVFSYSKKTGLARGGFSKFIDNDLVHIFATANPKEDNRVSAVKIISLTFGNSPAIIPAISEEKSTPSATPKLK